MNLVIPELEVPKATRDALARGLFTPLEDFFSRPSKALRAPAIELGYRLAQVNRSRAVIAGQDQHRLQHANTVIEALHAGSLIIDDIQDQATVRRGETAIHSRYGVPIALNAGNWLYFHATSQIELLDLSPQSELECRRLASKILSLAHLGQAIDISTQIDQVPQSDVHEIVTHAMELKTGALMGFAVSLGAMIGEASPDRIHRLNLFGRKIGVCLQMMDDLSNLLTTDSERRFRDLYLRRPTWPWVFAAKQLSSRDYSAFVYAVTRLPNESFLVPWLSVHEFERRARMEADRQLDLMIEEAKAEFSTGHLEQDLSPLLELIQKLRTSYV